MGKSCHCGDHTPLDHYGIKPNSENDITLTINGIEVPGAAGFLQAYHRQSENLISERVKTSLNRDFAFVRKVLQEAEDQLVDLKEYKNKKQVFEKIVKLLDHLQKETVK